MATSRSARSDPFFLVRDEISGLLEALTESFRSWEKIPNGEKGKGAAGADILRRAGEAEGMLKELAGAVDVARANPGRFGVDADEVARRAQWVDNTRGRLKGFREKVEASQKVVNVEAGGLLNALRAGNAASAAASRETGAAAALERERERDNDAFLDAQERSTMQIMRQQDEELDELGGAVRRLGDVGLTIGRELEEQQVMLEELEEDVETTRGKLRAAQRKMEKLVEKAGMRGQLCIILFLVVVLAVLSYFVFG